MGHLLIHNFPPLQLLLQLSIQPFHLHKCESIQSRVKRRVLLSRCCFFWFFSPRLHGLPEVPLSISAEDEEVGEMIDNFSFAYRSIFALDRSLGRKDVGDARTCFLFLPRCHFHACLFLHYTHVVQFSLAYFFFWLIFPSGPLFSLGGIRNLLGCLFFRCRCRLLPEVWQHSGPFLHTFWETLDGCRWN